jgi:membrane fusion protein (multidrug efflux system)
MTEKQSFWRRIRKLLISLVIISCAVAVVVSIARMPGRTVDVVDQEIPLVNVEVLKLKPVESLPDYLELPGTIEPNTIVNVPVEMAGTIEKIFPEEGDLVNKGDIILRLDSKLLEAELNRAKAQAEFDRKTLERSTSLLERGVVNQSQVEEAEARSVISDANFEVAKTNLDRTVVYSPITGILDEMINEEGEFVGRGDVVARIVDVGKVKVSIQVPEKDTPFIRNGATISVSVDALNNRQFQGIVTYMSEIADQSTRSTRVEITVDNSHRQLRAGMIVRTKIRRRTLSDVVMVPLASIIPLEEGRVVYIEKEGIAEKREVEIGLIKGTEVQILSGLNPGDNLIVLGHRLVGPGQRINVVKSN